MKTETIPGNRSHRLILGFLAITLIFAMSASVYANRTDSSNTVAATIRISAAVKIGNTQLAAGEYKVIADENQAKFQKGSKVVAEVPCTLKPLPFMPHQTSFVTANGSISEIQVSGSEMAIEF